MRGYHEYIIVWESKIEYELNTISLLVYKVPKGRCSSLHILTPKLAYDWCHLTIAAVYYTTQQGSLDKDFQDRLQALAHECEVKGIVHCQLAT